MIKTSAPSIEDCLKRKWPVYVVYRESDKEVVGYWPFGESFARESAQSRNNKEGPLSYNYAKWDRYLFVLERHERHLEQLEEISKRL